jgi:hypothetical protein
MRRVLLGLALTLVAGLVTLVEAGREQATRLRASDPPTTRGIYSETHEYLVALQARQTLHLVVKHTGADPVIVVRAPDGGVITEMDTPDGPNGSKSLWLVASATGDHTISVRARGVARAGSGEYVLRVEALRETTPEDRKRLEMQNAWFIAFRLLDEGPRRYAAAGERLKKTITAARALKDDVMASAASNRLVRLDPKAALDTLELKFVPGAPPLYYSSGHEQRAMSIRDRLRPAIDFFESKLQVKVQMHVAVLARDDWTRLLTGVLYGMPWPVLAPGDPTTSSPRAGLVGMPATTELTKGPVAALQKPGVLPPDIAAAVKATGLSFEEGMRLWSDEVMYHELGHIYTIAYGIEVEGWLNEFLAQFLAVAYEAEAAPPAGPVRAFSDALRHFALHTYKPKRVALEDIQHGASAYPADYNWYQYQFLVRAEEVYKAHGIASCSASGTHSRPVTNPCQSRRRWRDSRRSAPRIRGVGQQSRQGNRPDPAGRSCPAGRRRVLRNQGQRSVPIHGERGGPGSPRVDEGPGRLHDVRARADPGTHGPARAALGSGKRKRCRAAPEAADHPAAEWEGLLLQDGTRGGNDEAAAAGGIRGHSLLHAVASWREGVPAERGVRPTGNPSSTRWGYVRPAVAKPSREGDVPFGGPQRGGEPHAGGCLHPRIDAEPLQHAPHLFGLRMFEFKCCQLAASRRVL